MRQQDIDKKRLKRLAKQFTIRQDLCIPQLEKVQEALTHLMDYTYDYTEIEDIETIDEQVLHNYIEHCLKAGVSPWIVVKHIRYYIFYLKYIKKKRRIPQMNLSVYNTLWKKI